MSSDNSGSTQIIHDNLNDYDWLRWDTLASLTYDETLAATSVGGQFDGWQFADANEAQLFTNALLQGLTNDCTTTGGDVCNMALPSNLTDLLGDTPGTLTETVNFLVKDGDADNPAGYLQYSHEGDYGSVFKSNAGGALENSWRSSALRLQVFSWRGGGKHSRRRLTPHEVVRSIRSSADLQ